MTDVTMSKPVLDTTMVKALLRDRYKGFEWTKNLMALQIALRLHQKNPGLGIREITDQVDQWRQKFDEEVGRGEIPLLKEWKTWEEESLWAVEVGSKVAEVLPAPLGSAVAETVSHFYKKFFYDPHMTELSAEMRIEARRLQKEAFLNVRLEEDKILDAYSASTDATDPEANFRRSLFDEVVGIDLNVSLQDLSAAKIIDTNPQLKVPPKVRQAIKPDGSLVIAIGELRTLVQGELDGLEGMMKDSLAYLKVIDAKQNILVAYVADQLEKEKAERQERIHQQIIDGASSSVYLLSTFIGFADPKLGKEIYVVGNAAIQIADSISKFATSAAKLTDVALKGLSSAVLAGNILGAVMNVVSLFVEQGPTPEQMILDEIGKLQDQVSQLRTEMHDRFDRIDRSLIAIYEMLQTRFDRIDTQLGELAGDVNELQEELARIELRLGRFTSNAYEWLRALGQRELRTAINGAIAYKERTGENIEFSDYADDENVFHSWATINAFDELEQDTQNRDYGDDDVLRELDRPLETNIMYLATWLSKKGLPSFATTPLANPTTWSISARAHVELRSEWSGYARRISSARNDQVEEVGDELRSALERVTLGGTPSNPQANRALFDGLHSNYVNKYKELDESLHRIESEYLAEWKNANDREGAPDIDLWGGAQQQTDYSPPGLARMGLDPEKEPENLSLPAAPNNIRVFVPTPYLLADYLKLNTPGLITLVIPLWDDIKFVWNDRIQESVEDSAVLWVDVTVYYGGTAANQSLHRRFLKTRRYRVGELTPGENWTMGDPWKAFRKLWSDLKAKFEAGLAEEIVPTDQQRVQREQLLGTVTNQVENELEEHQKQIYTRIRPELRAGPLHDAALRLSGAKALLDAFINVGMPRAVESDDYLRAFLNGSQSLLDAEQVSERYASAQGEGPNVRVGIFQDAERRVDALHKVLNGYLDQIESGAHMESQPLLSTTLLRSSVVNRIVRLADASDNAPPETTITSGPSDSTTSTSATFEFSSSEPNSTFLCRLDDASRSPCSPPMSYDILAPGTHTFQVQAIDYAGNIDTTLASRTWTVETAP